MKQENQCYYCQGKAIACFDNNDLEVFLCHKIDILMSVCDNCIEVKKLTISASDVNKSGYEAI